MEFKFKNVGKKIDQVQQERSLSVSTSRIPIGIKTPLKLGKNGQGLFIMHHSPEDQIEDNLRNLLQSNFGERLGIYDVGANLRPLLSELVSSDFESEAMARITRAVAKFMPLVNLQSFKHSIDNSQNSSLGKIVLEIVWGIPILGIKDKKMRLVLFVI